MSAYTEFFLNGRADVAQLELLSISHPDFTQDYHLVRNKASGVTVTLETAASQAFQYVPMRISQIGVRDNLDFGLRVDLGDLGEVLPLELDAVATAGGFGVKPTVTYRTYRSDNLTAPLFGPVVLEVPSFAFTDEGASFEAEAPRLNVSATGELYTLDRFPMLRGLL
jgi:hypothetical protein